eukprot:scaffold89101_cov65-Attheya_sp.AAC.1
MLGRSALLSLDSLRQTSGPECRETKHPGIPHYTPMDSHIPFVLIPTHVSSGTKVHNNGCEPHTITDYPHVTLCTKTL